jgi:hypothetical protein
MFDIFIMDMGGHDDNVQSLVQRFPHARVVRYYDNHLDTLKRCISRCRTPYAWIISSCCDYADFDFGYRAVPWESYQLHCWASGNQEFGDTFLINKTEFLKQLNIELLEWYKDINWHEVGVPRLAWPVLECTTEDITEHITNAQFNSSYLWINETADFDPPLWKDRCFYSFNMSGSVSLAPREIQTHLTSQIYDYPYVIKQKDTFLSPNPLDIIYISNGEPDAERWYDHLVTTCGHEVKRVQNVNGRAQAYQAAAMTSDTDWFFTVFAKLEVVNNFDWSWQPDYLQKPKHYIFNSQNPVNGLEYGHMGVIAYNKTLVLDTNDSGLDFTLSRAHAVVPMLSAIAHYNTTPELTWRTAFRECVKLRDDIEKTGSIESQYRLDIWRTVAEGNHAEWSINGAKDAVAYWESVNGEYDKLMLSFEWAWLQEYFKSNYNTAQHQL